MNIALIYLFLSIISAAATEESTSLKNENILQLKLPANPLNSQLYPPEIKSQILETTAIFNCEKVFHVSNLELVCKDWSRVINDRFTIIKNIHYKDPTTPIKLKENLSVIHLILHAMSIDTINNDLAWCTYVKVIQVGLQNKPKLKTLTFSRTLSAGMLLGFTLGLDDNGFIIHKPDAPQFLSPDKNPPADFLNLPHLRCFSHLERLLVSEWGGSEYNWDGYFTRYFMNPKLLPDLKMFKIDGTDMLSRYSPEERQ